MHNTLYLMPVDIEVLRVFIPVWVPHVCCTQSRFWSWGFSSRTYPQLRLQWHHAIWYTDNNMFKYSEDSGDKESSEISVTLYQIIEHRYWASIHTDFPGSVPVFSR